MLKVKEIMEALKSFDQEAYVDINLSLSENYNKGDKLYYVATPEEEEGVVVLNIMDADAFINSVVDDFSSEEISSKSSEELCEEYNLLEKEAFVPLLEKARKISSWVTL